MRNTDKVIGIRETLKMLKKKRVEKVILANDTDEPLKNEILSACRDHDVPVQTVNSKEKLGQSCGIERAAAVVAFLKKD